MSKFTMGLIIYLATAVNLFAIGGLLVASWNSPDTTWPLSLFLLFWFLLNIGVALAAFGPEPKD